MAVHRLSALEIFGIPVDTTADLVKDIPGHVQLYRRYGVEPVLVEPTEPTDVTPYYWDEVKKLVRFMLSSSRRGEAVIDVMPMVDDLTMLGYMANQSMIAAHLTRQRTVRLPQDQPSLVLMGTSPRYPDKKCLVESFVDL
jgi:hypothetical protein